VGLNELSGEAPLLGSCLFPGPCLVNPTMFGLGLIVKVWGLLLYVVRYWNKVSWDNWDREDPDSPCRG
jgi:hypothetical protein